MRKRHWVLMALTLLTVLLPACGGTTPVLGTTTFTCQLSDLPRLTGCTDPTKNNLRYRPYQEIDNSNGSLAVTLRQLDGQNIVPTTDGPYQYHYIVLLFALQDTQDAYVVTIGDRHGNGPSFKIATVLYYIEGSDTVQFTAVPIMLPGTPAKNFHYSIAVHGQKLMIKRES